LGCQENIHGILKKTPLPLPWVVKKAFMEYWIKMLPLPRVDVFDVLSLK
jgi:hypothetical protein